jgi:hypothetical protein
MPLSLRLRVHVALTICLFCACAAHGEKLRITSTPPGAKVEVNGVPLGTHSSSISKTLEMSAGTSSEHSPHTSSSSVATGTITFAEPEGAEIYVDDQLVGHVPCTVQLTEGPHRIRILDGRNARLDEKSVFAWRKQGNSPRPIPGRPLNRSQPPILRNLHYPVAYHFCTGEPTGSAHV